MSHLRAASGIAGLWRWTCGACDTDRLRWFLTETQAIGAARAHSHASHPEYHDAPADPPGPAARS